MTASRLALVSDDQRLASAVQAHLTRAFGQPVFQTTLDGIRGHLVRDTEGLFLLAVAGEAEPVVRMVQEVYLQQLAPVVVVAEERAAGALARIDPYVAQRLAWPQDAGRLVQLIRERLGRGRDVLA
jgi:DNA-binding NtrC family response regulator